MRARKLRQKKILVADASGMIIVRSFLRMLEATGQAADGIWPFRL